MVNMIATATRNNPRILSKRKLHSTRHASQRRHLSTFMDVLKSPSSKVPQSLLKNQDCYSTLRQAQDDLQHAIQMVRAHDPAGYLPGRLLPTAQMTWTYYATRSFWVETGLRMGSTALLSKTATPKEQLDFWKKSIEDLYDEKHDESSILQHPTLRLLRQLKHPSIGNSGSPTTTLSKCHFDDILKGRREDLSIKQYATLEELEEHAVWSCGSLSQLVLEADGIFPEQHPLPHQAARLVGQAHGLTNALRLSIPIVSTTGRLIIPQDLCEKYGVKSPRYLLSALGQGDAGCTRALQRTVQEIVARARRYLQEARELRHDLFETGMVGEHSVAVLLPALTSETFLNRLEAHNFDLTDRNLRNVNMLEHARCASNLLHAAWLQKY